TRLLSGLVILTLLLVFVEGCKDTVDPAEPPIELFFSAPTELGTPTDATPADDILIRRFQYAMSYNPVLNVANWVSWNEDSAWYGPAQRQSSFVHDDALPAGCTRILDSYYTGSGYDRGHIVGSECRTRSDSDNKATFFFSNVFPQTPDLNRETWYSLERYCDSLSKEANKTLYVIAGGVFSTKKRLKNVVTIPDSCWKVVVVMERGSRWWRITKQTRVIAVMMNNGTYTTADNHWERYRTTVRNIERQTGYDLLSAVP
ncbi:MAG: DNA/RNA non-specific endonuclease, partial [Candidatus Kapaibacterium sp.]